MQSALSAKVAEGNVLVVSELAVDQAKTKALSKALVRLGITGSALLVVGSSRSDVMQAAQNLVGIKVVEPERLNVYDVLRVQTIVIPERELERVKEAWS